MAPTILVTGFTGGLGASVFSTLQDLVPASSLAASSSGQPAASLLEGIGVEFRRAAYDDFNSLLEAFHGIQKLFFVSTNTFDNEKRTIQHRNVIEAAKQAGVDHVSPVHIRDQSTTANPQPRSTTAPSPSAAILPPPKSPFNKHT